MVGSYGTAPVFLARDHYGTVNRPRQLCPAADQGRADDDAARRARGHNGSMGRKIGTILGAILAIWLAVTAFGGIVATFKMFLIIGLIAMVVFIIVWLVAGRSRRG